MTKTAMQPLNMQDTASSTGARSLGTAVSVTAAPQQGDVFMGPSIPDGATLENVTVSIGGIDGAKEPAFQYAAACDGLPVISEGGVGYVMASTAGFGPTRMSGPVTLTVTKAPTSFTAGSITLMVYFTPAATS
ncbi:hypothetical protein [Burkholderia gladioli]|uniref:hypothetical protein n=1 Tax=Burkholderia gladioli TaxID=28095 RepID=UPI00164088A3|nr:hypothetical protein [Burkholderia gladioli]